MHPFTSVALIANPASQNGAAQKVITEVYGLFKKELGGNRVKLFETTHPRHAQEIAAGLDASFDTIVAIGGDGVIHEIANGLMQRSDETRPVLGVVPFGSGNDYAKTLGISNNVSRAVTQILAGRVKHFDVGNVNGEYFVETLSFGLDAAIAIDTVERRKTNSHKGTLLYVESGFDQLFHHLVPYDYSATLRTAKRRASGNKANVRTIQGQSFIFAVQIGPTYGGRFKVCPKADPTDGLFDICLAHPPLSILKATLIFLMARFGWHTHFSCIEFLRATSVTVEFTEPLPVQADGEKIEGTSFDIAMCPQALSVLVAPSDNR